jgi:hypothetical protein
VACLAIKTGEWLEATGPTIVLELRMELRQADRGYVLYWLSEVYTLSNPNLCLNAMKTFASDLTFKFHPSTDPHQVNTIFDVKLKPV